ncbi:FGGY family carbohydrate kinase [Kineococcus rubinsiae]|uniref:FGGY family carbohydrate kinase n=1 Tax=Kineococcus rubinsiae TaxID=2609562 RepID=UPI00142FC026|nr:FGGY family carbohydrate kinase [Kineococcus rubinsiae]
MARRLFVGVDVGTSVVKAVALDERGREVGVRSDRVPLERPRPQHAEQDTGAVVAAVASVLRQLTSAVDGEVALVSVTGQGDGCWLVDADGRPVAPGITWMDGRSAAVVRRWQEDGTADRLARSTGTSVFPGVQACLLAWLDEHDPGTLDRATTAAYAKDVVFQALTGERCTDVSDASAVFGRPPGDGTEDGATDGLATGYDPRLLRLCGLEHRAGLLAPVTAPVPCASSGPAAAQRFGLPSGTPVTAGPFDIPACEVGAGLVRPGDAVLVLGTALACSGPARVAAGAALDRGGMLVRTPTPQGWSRMLPAMVGTPTLDWALQLLRLGHEDLDPLLRQSAGGSGGVRVLPHLSPSGERAPFVDTAATGQLLGVSLTTTPADVLRAVCESLAHTARQCLEALGATGEVVVCGGGVRSRTWLQIIASTLGRPLRIASTAQVGARGAVLAGLAASGAGADVDAAAWPLLGETVDPVPELARRADESHALFLADQAEARSRWRRERGDG